MSPQPWPYALLAVGVVYALALASVWWSGRWIADGVALADGTERSTDSKTVDCPECGTTNGRRYRYCANCVSELPGGDDLGDTPTAPIGRQLR